MIVGGFCASLLTNLTAV